MLWMRAASQVERGLLSNYPNVRRHYLLRGSHHRRCAREGLTGCYDASVQTQVANPHDTTLIETTSQTRTTLKAQ